MTRALTAITVALLIVGTSLTLRDRPDPQPVFAAATATPTCRQAMPAWRCALREQRHAIWTRQRAAAWLGHRLDEATPAALAYGPLDQLRATNQRLRRLIMQRRRELAAWPARAICQLPWAHGCAPALRVTHCEDPSGDPAAISATDDHGLFQINRPTWSRVAWIDWSRIYDAAYNAWVAFRISNAGRDWSPWTCGWAAA